MKIEGFKFHGTNQAYFAHYKDGAWQEGSLQSDIHFNISALAVGIQYGQSIFEGLKAYKSKEGKVLLFRADANYQRLKVSSARLMIPELPAKLFMDAIYQVVRANKALIPAFETEGSLYIRPFILGTETCMGVRPAKEFVFGVVATPVGSYFTDGFKPIRLLTSAYDRAAPNGLGHIKAGANYAASLYPKYLAKEQGFDDCLYLDPKTHTKLDETGATNVIGIQGNTFVTPQSSSILPSITNASLQVLAKEYLKMDVQTRPITIEELKQFDEFGACGTAAVITPISLIQHKTKKFHFKKYEILHKLYKLLQSIQYGVIKEPYGWVVEV